MAWSLVDALSLPGDRRRFFLPLASIPPGNTTVRTVDPNQFDPSDGRLGPSDPILKIIISPPTGSAFSNEGDLPDPAIRLHAMTQGIVRFEPADILPYDRLILDMIEFLGMGTDKVPWWQRWIEASCIPYQVIYEGVDKDQLRQLLEGMLPGEAFYGLKFPQQVKTAADQSTFINGFLAGTTGFKMAAEAGAVLGTAGGLPNAPARLLNLHVRYQDHTTTNPHPMNPRELLHLLFGNDSDEATHHPLLVKIDAVGQAQTGNESKTMRLRPPLRTFKRVEWEANQEIEQHPTNWSPAGSLGADRLYNTHTWDSRTFENANYTRLNKCNLFVSDICLRAGFRVNIHPVDKAFWHYIDAISYCNLSHCPSGNLKNCGGPNQDRVGLMGQSEDAALAWGWNIENWIRAINQSNLQDKLNTAISEEGRCFILAGARARKFRNDKTDCSNVAGAFCVCKTPEAIGHIVIVQQVLDQPTLAPTTGQGFQRIQVSTLEASGTGATSKPTTFQLGGQDPSSDAGYGLIRLQLIELHPGGDPDDDATILGLRNLNVININRNLLRTPDEAAKDKRLSNNPDGTNRSDNVCCHDQWPTSNTVTQVPCAQ